jgi:hypothetical protein
MTVKTSVSVLGGAWAQPEQAASNTVRFLAASL